MSTKSDAHSSNVAPRDPLEAGLIEVFAVQPSAAVVGRLDDRIGDRLLAWSPPAARRSRLRPGRRAGVIGLLAATFVVGGATGSLQACTDSSPARSTCRGIAASS